MTNLLRLLAVHDTHFYFMQTASVLPFSSLKELLFKDCKWTENFSTYFANFFPTLKILQIHHCLISYWFLKKLLFSNKSLKSLTLVQVGLVVTFLDLRRKKKKDKLQIKTAEKKRRRVNINVNDVRTEEEIWVTDFCSGMDIPVEIKDDMIPTISKVVLIRTTDNIWTKDKNESGKTGDEIFFETCKLDLMFFDDCSNIMQFDNV